MAPEVRDRIEQIRHGNVPEGYVKSDAGIIPASWQCKSIGSSLRIKNNERKPISEEVRQIIPGPYPYYGPTQAQGYISTYESEGPAVLIAEDGDHFLKYKFKPMTLWIDGKYTVNNHAHIICGTDVCHAKWFYYVYEFKPLLNAITRQGAGRYKLTKDALVKLPIQLPTPAEQKKIADILTTQDKVIELKEKMLAEKQRQKKHLMQQLLTGKKRLHGFDRKWRYVELGMIAKKEKEKNKSFAYNLVLSNSAQHGIIPQTDQFDKEIASEDRIDGYYIVHDGFFVYNPRISLTAPCGPINRNDTGKVGVMSPLYTIFSIESKMVNTDFLKQYFSSSCWYRHMKSVANYGARHDRMNVSDDDFFLMPIPIPSIEEQAAMADTLMAADKEIELLNQDLEQEKQKKKALMQLLLTGIVGVTA